MPSIPALPTATHSYSVVKAQGGTSYPPRHFSIRLLTVSLPSPISLAQESCIAGMADDHELDWEGDHEEPVDAVAAADVALATPVETGATPPAAGAEAHVARPQRDVLDAMGVPLDADRPGAARQRRNRGGARVQRARAADARRVVAAQDPLGLWVAPPRPIGDKPGASPPRVHRPPSALRLRSRSRSAGVERRIPASVHPPSQVRPRAKSGAPGAARGCPVRLQPRVPIGSYRSPRPVYDGTVVAAESAGRTAARPVRSRSPPVSGARHAARTPAKGSLAIGAPPIVWSRASGIVA